MAMYDSLGVPVLDFHNPAGSTFYPKGLYTYAIGNTRGRDVLETFGTKKGQHLDLLLLASGDVRHLLFTISELSLRKPAYQPNSISFHINDYDPSVVARNVVILELVDTINPDVADDIDFLWNVWYNMTLSKAHIDRLREVLTSLIERNFDGGDSFLKFQANNVLKECRNIWRDWREMELDVNSVKKERNQVIENKSSALNGCYAIINQAMMAPSDMRDVISPESPFYQEINHWFREGSTNDELAATNPTLIRPFVHMWRVHYSACAFEGYLPLHREELLGCGSFTDACKGILKLLVKRFQQLKRLLSVQVTSWTGDCLWLCTSGLPKELLFDVIDTSNVSDHIGLLNVLVCCGLRLKSSLVSQLFTSSMVWYGHYESIEEYYDKCVGVHPYLLPTVLGLKLAVDFDLGSRKLPDRTDMSEETLCWVKTETTKTLLKIDESSDIIQALQKLTERCFNLVGETHFFHGAFLPSPLTLLRIMQQLQPFIDGGATHILNILHGKLPLDFDEKFGLSWNLIKAAIGVKQEPIIEVEVRVDCSAVSLECTPMPMIVIQKHKNDVFPWQTFFDLCNIHIPEKVQVIYNSLRYDEARRVVIFHLVENDWNKLKENSWLKIETNNSQPDIDSETVFLGSEGGAILSVNKIDPVATFGLFSVMIFNVIRQPWEEDHLLEVIKVEECQNSYIAELAMRDPSKCLTKYMKINYLPDSCPTAVNINFGEVIGCTLYFTCSIEKSSTFQCSKKLGKITCQFPKKQDGTVGELVLRNPAPIPFHTLPCWETRFDTALACGRMFRTKLDKQLRLQGKVGGTFHNLRESISIILQENLKQPEKPQIHILEERNLVDGHYHVGLLKRCCIIKVEEIYLWKCIPIAKVVVFNSKVYDGKLGVNPNDPKYAEIKDFFVQEVMPYPHHLVPANQKEFDLFEKMLRTNAARTPQEYVSNSRWKASFICTIFPRSGLLNPLGFLGLQRFLPGSMPSEIFDVPTNHQISINVNTASSSCLKPNETECRFCLKKSENLKRCMGCKKVFYCSTYCQGRHWRVEHKNQCGIPKSPELKFPGDLFESSSKPSQKHDVLTNALSNSVSGDVGTVSSSGLLSETECSFCYKKSKDLKRCVGCKKVFYCSTLCQQRHWRIQNKTECGPEINVLHNLVEPGTNVDTASSSVQLFGSKCNFCGKKSENIKKCMGCKKVFYCDTYCQQHHWKVEHKTQCGLQRVLPGSMPSEIFDVPTNHQISINVDTASSSCLKPNETECSFCQKKSENLKRCTGCKKVFYCSTHCQGRHWRVEHKNQCGKPKSPELKFPGDLFESSSKPSQKHNVLTNALSNSVSGDIGTVSSSGLLSETECSFCYKKSKDLKRCMGCKKVFYCSTFCQQRHWRIQHKTECGPEISVSRNLVEPGTNVDTAASSVQLFGSRCNFCGKKSENIKKCMGCKKVFYCDTSCQQHHWKVEHKTQCDKITSAR